MAEDIELDTSETVIDPDPPIIGDGLGMLPRPGEPESALEPGMSAPVPRMALHALARLTEEGLPEAAIILPIDTSIGPVALEAPSRWAYDFNPATGNARASYDGEVAGASSPAVNSFNTRTGAVVLTTADVTGVGGATTAGVAASYAPLASPTFTGAVTIPAGAAISGYAPLASPAFTGNTSAVNLAVSGLISPSDAGIKGETDGTDAPAGSVGEYIIATASSITLANGVSTDLGGINLTAGDWDIDGIAQFSNASGMSAVFLTISPDGTPNAGGYYALGFSTAIIDSQVCSTGTLRVSVTALTTFSLMAQANFSAGSSVVNNAAIRARRVR